MGASQARVPQITLAKGSQQKPQIVTRLMDYHWKPGMNFTVFTSQRAPSLGLVW